MSIKIFCTLQYEGYHHWANAPEGHFLRDKHRHIFHIKAIKYVSHFDRDIEFIEMKNQIIFFLSTSYGKEFGGMSCEDIALLIFKKFDLSFCEVSEDGENGAIIED